MPQNQNLTGHSLFHVRQLKGGTVLIDGAQATKVNLKTDSTLSAGVYPAWHPKNDQFIAFSVNETGQVFHTRDVQKIEVIDFGSNLILYDAAKNQVFDIDCRTDEFETFPTWSPDGQWLYYVSAHYEQQSDNIDAELNSAYPQLKYNIYRRSFNAGTRKFGERELVLDAAAMDKSASTPRISPDGKWILFALADYGQFHIWHNSSRLYAMPTGLGTDTPDPQTTVHLIRSPRTGDGWCSRRDATMATTHVSTLPTSTATAGCTSRSCCRSGRPATTRNSSAATMSPNSLRVPCRLH